MDRPPRWTVIIPTHDTRELTLACLTTLPHDPAVEIVVVDDASRDGTRDAIESRFPWVRVIRLEESEGFTRAANRGLEAARGRYLFLLNSDTELEAGAREALERAFESHPRLGIAGGRLHYADGRAQWSGGPAPSLLWLFGLASGIPPLVGRLPGVRRLRPVRGAGGGGVHWVTGAAMAIRREVLEEIGLLDTDFHFYCQDLELCSRAQSAGWEIAVVAHCRVLHHHGSTIGRRAGTTGSQHPAYLWTDLLRWAHKTRGRRWSRRAALALETGGRIRLAARGLGGCWRTGAFRRQWEAESLAYRQALRAIRTELEDSSRRSRSHRTHGSPSPRREPTEPPTRPDIGSSNHCEEHRKE